MIRSLTFLCSECGVNFTVMAAQFEKLTRDPVICNCGDIFSIPSQKLFWIAEKLKQIWFNLPKKGITIDRPPKQLARTPLSLKVKEIPFRIKHYPDRYYLRFDEDDCSACEAVVTLIFDQTPPLQIALDKYQTGPEPGWQALPELAYWTRRLNQEIAELDAKRVGVNRVVEIGFYASSAIHRRRK